MTTGYERSRLLAAQIAEAHSGAESRAFTVLHPGQMTIADYYRLDDAGIEPITMLARVRTSPRGTVNECLGIDAGGWLVRAKNDRERWPARLVCEREAEFEAMPYLRLVDEHSGFAYPDPLIERECGPARGSVSGVAPFAESHPDCDRCNAERE